MLDISSAKMTASNPLTSKTALAFYLFLVTAAPSCRAQGGTAELFGQIEDSSGGPVSNAQVRVQELATGTLFKATSAQGGAYHFLGLPIGQYVLTVEAAGFRTYNRSGIALRIGDQVSIPVRLENRPTFADDRRYSGSVAAADGVGFGQLFGG